MCIYVYIHEKLVNKVYTYVHLIILKVLYIRFKIFGKYDSVREGSILPLYIDLVEVHIK